MGTIMYDWRFADFCFASGSLAFIASRSIWSVTCVSVYIYIIT